MFGTEPNAFLKSCAPLLRKGERALAIADGEGRNGVFLAEQGLDVLSLDFSPVAQEKARKLAKERGVTLKVEQADIIEMGLAGGRVRCGGGDLFSVRLAGRARDNFRWPQEDLEAGRPFAVAGLWPQAD